MSERYTPGENEHYEQQRFSMEPTEESVDKREALVSSAEVAGFMGDRLRAGLPQADRQKDQTTFSGYAERDLVLRNQDLPMFRELYAKGLEFAEEVLENLEKVSRGESPDTDMAGRLAKQLIEGVISGRPKILASQGEHEDQQLSDFLLSKVGIFKSRPIAEALVNAFASAPRLEQDKDPMNRRGVVYPGRSLKLKQTLYLGFDPSTNPFENTPLPE